MKAALYLRVSTDAQDYARQETELTEQVGRDGAVIVYTFSDKISGLKDETHRDGLSNLLKLTKEDVDVIYVSELSRLSRNPTNLAQLVDTFCEKGINIYFQSQNLNTLNKEGKRELNTDIFIGLLSQYSKYEIQLKNERSQSGKKEAILNRGEAYTGNPPFGYRVVNKMLVVHEAEAAIVSHIFNRYTKGAGVRELQRELNKSSSSHYSKIGEFWSTMALVDTMKNTVYAGHKRVKLGNTYADITTPAIVSKELFEAAQKEIKNRVSFRDKSTVKISTLRGVFFCGECGKTFTANSVPGGIFYYRCSDISHKRANKQIGCTNGTIFQKWIEPMVWNSIKEYFVNSKNEELRSRDMEYFLSKIDELAKHKQAEEQRIEELQGGSKRLISAYTKGIISEEELAIEKRRIDNEVSEANRNINRLWEIYTDTRNKLTAINESGTKSYDIAVADNSPILQKEAIREMIKTVKFIKIDKFYSVVAIEYKTGQTVLILRSTWKQEYIEMPSTEASYDKEAKTFTYKGETYPPKALMDFLSDNKIAQRQKI